jgi:hypothetical protein
MQTTVEADRGSNGGGRNVEIGSQGNGLRSDIGGRQSKFEVVGDGDDIQVARSWVAR